MARKTTSPPSKPEPASLAKPREQVRAQLLARIEIGEELLSRQIGTHSRLNDFRADYYKWDDYNSELLRRAFTSGEYTEEYSRSSGFGVMFVDHTLEEEVQDARESVIRKRDRLVSLVERLDLIDEQPGVSEGRMGVPSIAAPEQVVTGNKKVFLVHGQDEEAKAIVARFITGCGLEPIILHEQPNGGRTIIEKFEKEADVGFAVILMTPDDVGGRRRSRELQSDDLKARARQNVILELGYFAGRLGRERVAALKKGDIEMPSDIAGVVWTTMDTADAWKMSLARELRSAGYQFDVGKALGI